MSLLSNLPVIGELVDSISNGLDELFTSDEELGQIDIEKKKLELKKRVTELKAQHAQLQINMAQANHPSIFVAGARPAIIWIGALGLAYEAILRPILSWLATRFIDLEQLMGAEALAKATPEQVATLLHMYELPSINDDLFMPIVLGVLGIGGMRSWEKMKGKARENLRPISNDYEQLAKTMTDKLRTQLVEMDRESQNPSIDEYRQQQESGRFKPYYPSEEELLR